MDTKEANKTIETNRHPLIKNICYEADTNKLMINDSENHHYLCDIFGRKKKKFLPYITGMLNRNKNQNLSQDKKSLTYFYTTNFSTKNISTKKRNNIATSGSTSNNNILTNKKYIDYFPTIRRFEGYSKFPRPIAPPLANFPKHGIKEKYKKKLIDNLKNYFDDEPAKNNVIRENENIGLSYLTGDLNEYDTIKYDTEHTLRLIDKTLSNFREEYRLKLNMMHKNPNVRALNEYKKKLLLNKNSKIINGRVLDEPSEKIKKNNKIIQSLINKTGLSSNKRRDKYRLSNTHEKKGKSRKSSFSESKNDIKTEYKTLGVDKLNNIFKIKDFTIGKSIHMDFGSSQEKENKNQSITDNNSSKENNKLQNASKTINTEKNNASKTINNEKNNESKKMSGTEENYKETEETAINNDNISKINENPKMKTLEEKIKDNEISFISYMSDNEKKYEKENNITIKSNRNIHKIADIHNKLLLGYKEKERKPDSIFLKPRPLNLKTDGDLYRENINLLRTTNREAFKIQEQKDLYDLKLLEKKLKIFSINATNVMKGKTLKPKKAKQNNDNI